MKKTVRKILLVVIAGLFLWFVLHTVLITLSGLQDNVQKADVAVVLGNEINADGQPSDRLKARLDKAVEVYKEGYFKNLIVSGGKGKEGFDEALVMAEYLVEKGIPQPDIILDSNGNTTEVTAENSARIMELNNWHSVIIVTQYFHIARTKLAFQKNGINEIYSAAPSYFEWRDLYSVSREFFGYYAYLLK